MPWKRRNASASKEAGQALLLFILILGLFLLGALCFAVDLTNLWFHRQAAQTAADAACTAGAMDLLAAAQGAATGHQGFTTGTAFDCSSVSTSAYPVCKYANFNGYDSANTTPGNLVSVSFPSTPPGVTAPPSAIAPTAFIRVDVLDRTQTFFAGLLNGNTTRDVRAFATCGVVLAASPLPLLVLDPHNPVTRPPQAALNVQGTPTIRIVGGPTQSIQVNSDRIASSCGQSNCANNLPWGTAQIDLSQGGPNLTGSDMGLWGGPVRAPAGFTPGTTGHWISPSFPISDPFAQVCAPGQTGCPSINGNTPPPVPTAVPIPPTDALALTPPCLTIPCQVPYHFHGCPDVAGCQLYEPGIYSSTAFPQGIRIGPGGSGVTAIFDPGIYYVQRGLHLLSGSLVRPGTGPSYTGAPGGTDGGTFFYFDNTGGGTATVDVVSNSGSRTTGIDNFSTLTGPVTSGGTSAYQYGVRCTSGSTVPSNLPATLSGNILLGICTGYYGDPLGASDPLGVQRGFLFFQDRKGLSVQPSWNGGGMFLLAGTMYFHSCNAAGTGVGCGAPGTYYNDVFTLQGNSGSNTYVLGSIVTDNLTLGGNSTIVMDLNPTVAYSTLKASLLQ
ncbi:MAG TPA: pilus assembly protein TadG-related protein [Terriglobales bacterium]|nr:pilus assembly protein TadG-related protein [Terriglobales bacterium]